VSTSLRKFSFVQIYVNAVRLQTPINWRDRNIFQMDTTTTPHETSVSEDASKEVHDEDNGLYSDTDDIDPDDQPFLSQVRSPHTIEVRYRLNILIS
jgi:hypothetical protein